MEMKIFVQLQILVDKMKGIVMVMIIAKMVLYVDQVIVQPHLVLTLKLIVVSIVPMLLTEKLDSVIVNLVQNMKEIVIPMRSARMV